MDTNSLHRLMKVLADSGEANSLAEAEKIFSRFGVRVVIGDDVAHDHVMNIIALTVINCAARSFQGNVQVEAPNNMALVAPGFSKELLYTFLDWLSIKPVANELVQTWPIIIIGKKFSKNYIGTVIRPWADGWEFGLGNTSSSSNLFAPACVAAGALAVSEAFSILRQDNPYAGQRSFKQSLWSVHSGMTNGAPYKSPTIDSCWLVGLGHLGQAYAWTIGFMLPARDATLYLQDVDTITKSTISTSMLSASGDITCKKTHTVARWLNERGYKTVLVECHFDEHQRVGVAEPEVGLFGVDNSATRRIMENAGFRLIIDAGLGSGYKDFRAIRIRTFPGPSSAASLWAVNGTYSSNLEAPAYQKLLSEGLEQCGVTTMASRAVGAPFVGCFAAAYVLAELTRRQVLGPSYACLDINLRTPQRLEAIS